MTRAAAMAGRLPPFYDVAPASLLSALLSHLALHLEEIDEQRLLIQRSHWIDTAIDRADVGKLGALLDRRLEPWEPTDLFRDHLQAIAQARLAGGVARTPLERFVADIVAAARRRLGLGIDAAAPGGTVLVENPPRTERKVVGPVTPLDWIDLDNHGLDAAPLEATLVGLPFAVAAVPVIAAPASGRLLGWAGRIPVGGRLRIEAAPGGAGLRATLDGEDATELLFSVKGFEPGTSLRREDLVTPAEPLMLSPGANRLWFITAGLFDRPALDAVMFAAARASLRQGRFDEDEFADALFYQGPTLHAELRWSAPEPAAFRIDVPGGAMTADPPLWPDRDEARERVSVLLNGDVADLRAVGVKSAVRFAAFSDELALTDRARPATGLRVDDPPLAAPSPEPDFGALLDVTPLDKSRLE